MWARALVLIAVGALGGLLFGAVSPQTFSPFSFAAATTCEAGAVGAVAEIGAVEAQTLCAEPGLVIADARSAERFAEGHIAAAVHLPCSSEPGRATALGRATKILVYADTTDEARPVAQALFGRYSERVLLLTGGFPAWMAAGQACASGPCESCRAGAPHADHPGHAAEPHAPTSTSSSPSSSPAQSSSGGAP